MISLKWEPWLCSKWLTMKLKKLEKKHIHIHRQCHGENINSIWVRLTRLRAITKTWPLQQTNSVGEDLLYQENEWRWTWEEYQQTKFKLRSVYICLSDNEHIHTQTNNKRSIDSINQISNIFASWIQTHKCCISLKGVRKLRAKIAYVCFIRERERERE